jgi:hypothetical protein
LNATSLASSSFGQGRSAAPFGTGDASLLSDQAGM